MPDRTKLLIMILSISGCASKDIKISDSFCRHTGTIFRCVKYVRNYDGDTITFNIPNLHPLFGKSISVRVRGINAPGKLTKSIGRFIGN